MGCTPGLQAREQSPKPLPRGGHVTPKEEQEQRVEMPAQVVSLPFCLLVAFVSSAPTRLMNQILQGKAWGINAFPDTSWEAGPCVRHTLSTEMGASFSLQPRRQWSLEGQVLIASLCPPGTPRSMAPPGPSQYLQWEDSQLNDPVTGCCDLTVNVDHCLGARHFAKPFSDVEPM